MNCDFDSFSIKKQNGTKNSTFYYIPSFLFTLTIKSLPSMPTSCDVAVPRFDLVYVTNLIIVVMVQ